MNNIKSFAQIFEAAVRIPRLNQKGLDYWKSKGKNGKDVMIYLHDDMDGIYSAVVVKERLLDLGYNIVGYGVVNYQESWKNTTLDPKMINVVVDFANMPEPDRKDLVDIYIDHHGEFSDQEKEFYRNDPVVKTKTGSAYEGICMILGKPADEMVLYSIDMIDSAKYDEYNVDWRDILNFSWDRFKEIAAQPGKVSIKPFGGSKEVELGWNIIAKMTFAGAFNQFLKRSDHKTVIEVVDNVKSASIYGIYHAMKNIYPGNNVWLTGYSKGQEKDFFKDGSWRINTMKKRTRGDESEKIIFKSQRDFILHTTASSDLPKPKGYQIIDNLMFVPSGTWANALRARAILLKDYDSGVIPKDHKIDFIMLQYGNTIQICGFEKLEKMDEYPILQNGEEMKDLAKYMTGLLHNFQKYLGYSDPDTTIGQEELTVSGGHVGIGTISNIISSVDVSKMKEQGKDTKHAEKYDGYRYLDLMKNKMINDLSTVKWGMGMVWSDTGEGGKGMMITDIINHDKNVKAEIKRQVDAGYDTERNIRKEMRDKLNKLSDAELREQSERAIKDHKVMKKKDIRKRDVSGSIPSRKEWEERQEVVSENLNNIDSFTHFFINEEKVESKDITPLKMRTDPPKSVVDAGNKIVRGGKVYKWDGSKWTPKGEASEEDKKNIPNV